MLQTITSSQEKRQVDRRLRDDQDLGSVPSGPAPAVAWLQDGWLCMFFSSTKRCCPPKMELKNVNIQKGRLQFLSYWLIVGLVWVWIGFK